MSDQLERGSDKYNECIDIWQILYIRIMNLRFSNMCLACLTMDFVNSYLPKFVSCLKWMEASNLYITVSEMLSTSKTAGQYTFSSFTQYNSDINTYIEAASVSLQKIVPDFRIIRNKVFAHADNKRDPKVLGILKYSDCIISLLQNLLAQCCQCLNISLDDVQVYSPDDFEKFQNEINLLSGAIYSGLRDSIEGKIRIDKLFHP